MHRWMDKDGGKVGWWMNERTDGCIHRYMNVKCTFIERWRKGMKLMKRCTELVD